MSFFTKHIFDPGPKVTPAPNSNNKETGENVPETTNSPVSQVKETAVDNSKQVVKMELGSKYLNYLEQLNIGKEGITYKDFRKILNKLRLKITDDEQAFNTAWISYTSIGGSESVEDLRNSLGDFVIALKKDSTLFETSVDEAIKKEKEPCFSEINSYEKRIHEVDAQIEILQKEREIVLSKKTEATQKMSASISKYEQDLMLYNAAHDNIVESIQADLKGINNHIKS